MLDAILHHVLSYMKFFSHDNIFSLHHLLNTYTASLSNSTNLLLILYVNYNNQWLDASPQVKQTLSSLDNNGFSLELGDHGYEIHLYNHDNGYTETWTTANDFKDAEFYHKELCKKCGIRIPMKG